MKLLIVLQRILALICCLGLASCASLSIPKQPSDDYIATLLEGNKFESALRTVDKWQDNFPNNLELPKQRKTIIQAIGRFETDTLKRAKQLDADDQWHETRIIYENALEILPSSQALQNAYSEFSVRRLNYINELKEDIDIERAKHWLSISAELKAMYNAAPNDREAKVWKEKSEAEREHLARRLVNYGLAHEKNKHFGTAALRYDLAYRLSPGEFTKPYHKRAAKTFAQRKIEEKQRDKANQQRQQTKLDQLIEDFDHYLEAKDFRLARQTLGAMEIIDANSPTVLDRKAQLDKQRNIELKKSIQDGKKFYTKGEFESAINAWTRALQFDPDNKEIKENIQRAEKFRDNLKRLKQDS